MHFPPHYEREPQHHAIRPSDLLRYIYNICVPLHIRMAAERLTDLLNRMRNTYGHGGNPVDAVDDVDQAKQDETREPRQR